MEVFLQYSPLQNMASSRNEFRTTVKTNTYGNTGNISKYTAKIKDKEEHSRHEPVNRLEKQ